MTFEIVTCDVRQGLAALAPESVQTCVTSPPYWATRAYQTTPQRWGGSPGCVHEWFPTASTAKTGGAGAASTKQVTNHGSQATAPQHAYRFRNGAEYLDHRLDSQLQGGWLCRLCAAWFGELGSEPTVDLYVRSLVTILRGVQRALRPDGTLWLNLGDVYTGSGRGPTGHNGLGDQARRQGFASPGPRADGGLGPKQLVGVPWRVALALQADGWVLRADIIWAKRAPMPESVRDRPTRSHEHLFLLAKRPVYYYDRIAVREPARTGLVDRLAGAWRNLRDVWFLGPENSRVAHYASYPTKLVAPCILAGTSAYGQCLRCGAPWQRGSETIGDRWRPTCRCAIGDVVPQTVLDPFCGTATTGLVAQRLGRHFIGLELNPQYAQWARERLEVEQHG